MSKFNVVAKAASVNLSAKAVRAAILRPIATVSHNSFGPGVVCPEVGRKGSGEFRAKINGNPNDVVVVSIFADVVESAPFSLGDKNYRTNMVRLRIILCRETGIGTEALAFVADTVPADSVGHIYIRILSAFGSTVQENVNLDYPPNEDLYGMDWETDLPIIRALADLGIDDAAKLLPTEA